ncbi:unnamed protein product [Cunninghamella blakesleeana]
MRGIASEIEISNDPSKNGNPLFSDLLKYTILNDILDENILEQYFPWIPFFFLWFTWNLNHCKWRSVSLGTMNGLLGVSTTSNPVYYFQRTTRVGVGGQAVHS